MNSEAEQYPRVLLVGPLLPTGGITRFLDFCLKAKLRANLQLFNNARPPKEKIAFRADGYNELFNNGLRRTFLGVLITVKNLCIFPLVLVRSGADVVHLAGTGWFPFWEFSIYGLIAKMFGKAAIFHFHGPFEDFYRRSSYFAQKMIEWLFGIFDAIFVLSEVDKKTVSSFLPKRKVYIIPNGVKINPDLSCSRDRDGRTIRILFLGGVDPLRKGLIDLIKAANLAAEEGIEMEWIVSGTETALAIINQYGLEKSKSSLKYVGKLTDIEKDQWFQQCDIFALPSYDEGMPYSILEAMSFGLAIISTDVGGIPEVVEEGVNGYLLKPGDAQGVFETMRKLKCDPVLLSKMSKNNVLRIQEGFSETEISRRIDEMYQMLANKK